MSLLIILLCLIIAILPSILFYFFDLERFIRFFGKLGGIQMWDEGPLRPLPTLSNLPTTTLHISPFTAERIPSEIREIDTSDKQRKRGYNDWYDIVKKEGGVTNWVNQSLVAELAEIGCPISHVGNDWESAGGQFYLSGEVLTVVRDLDLAQVAFRVKLNIGRNTLFRKIYSATIRPDGSISLTSSLGLDDVIRRPYIGVSNNRTNRLLTNALAAVIDSMVVDLKKALPYLSNSVVPAPLPA